MIATQIIKYVGRRKLLIIGHIAITILHAAVGVFDIAKMNYGVIVCVLLLYLFRP